MASSSDGRSESSDTASKAGEKRDETPSLSDAIQKLKETEDMLRKKSEFIVKKIDQQTVLIQKHGRSNKQAALNALKRKRWLEKQSKLIEDTISAVTSQRDALENAQTNIEVLKTMNYALEASAHTSRGTENEIDEVTEQYEESNETAEDINELLSAPPEEPGEDELLAELEEMEQAELDKLLNVDTRHTELPVLPDVPVAEAIKQKKATVKEV